MGKGTEWSEGETLQLCRSWLQTSEHAVRGAGQKRATFASRLYKHWHENKSAEDVNDRSALAVMGRWKKILPEMAKFEGILSKLKSKVRSGWTPEMYVSAALKIYAERYKHSFELQGAWEVLRGKPKWVAKLLTMNKKGEKRKADDVVNERPEGRKAAKAAAQEERNQRKKENVPADPSTEAHLRFVAASERKADLMEQQLHFNIFMQDPSSRESQVYFEKQRRAILAKLDASTEKTTRVVDTAHDVVIDVDAEEEEGEGETANTIEPSEAGDENDRDAGDGDDDDELDQLVNQYAGADVELSLAQEYTELVEDYNELRATI